jgi:DnaJ-class molecular chaperone
MEFKDYYASLGLSKQATDADIKRAYRKLAREFHPDLNPGNKTAEARFKEINEANEVLGDPEKRRKYDELGANWRAYEQQAGAPGAGAPWPGAGGAGGYRTMTPEEMREAFGADDPFSDFFHTFFGGADVSGARTRGRAGRTARATRGHDFETPVELTLDEVFQGTTRRLVVNDGDRERTVEVRIPAGVKDGARVRAAGEGGRGERGGSAGDLYLTVHIRPHPVFERRDADLHARVAVPVTTAVLGGEADVPVISGGTVRLRVPPPGSTRRVLRLRGHGMPIVGKAGERGDLYATVEPELPRELSNEERAHWNALKQIEDARKR